MEPGLTVILVLLILSVASLLLCTVKKAGTIPPMMAMVMGFGITMLSTRLEVDGYLLAFVALLGLLITGLSGSVLINGDKP